MHRMTTISVFGLGQVGLPTAVCFAKKGYRVIGIDEDTRKLEMIARGHAPFFEPHLAEYLKRAISSDAFSVTNDSSSNAQSDLAFISVGTASKEGGSIDLKCVEDAATSIGRSLQSTHVPQIVVVKSTVTPGTARNVVRPILERESGRTSQSGLSLCSNPEFLREGMAIRDVEVPDKIVIGSDDSLAIRRLEEFYKDFHAKNLPPVVRTTHENAELTKYANNAFLATKVSFINCVANIAERVPFADVDVVAKALGLDSRIGPQFLKAGLGWGGPCLTKDLDALRVFSKASGYSPELIEAVINTNAGQWRSAVQLIKNTLGTLRDKRISVLGLAFKAETDDMRGSISVPLITELLAAGATVTAYDPAATDNAKVIFGDRITYSCNPMLCVNQSDCCIIATECDEFKAIPPSAFAERMRFPFVLDGRRIYDANQFLKIGIKFLATGLGSVPVVPGSSKDLH